MPIDPRQLRHLLAIARTGSFSGAAVELNLSQPAISTSIARLESLLDTRLLERGRQGARLTPAGQILLRYANGIENLVSRSEEEVRMFGQGQRGPLRIAGTPMAALALIPPAVAELMRRTGFVSVEVQEDHDEELLESLTKHRIDMLISTLGVGNRPDIEDIPLFEVAVTLAWRKGHPLSQRERPRLSDLVDLPFALPPSGSAFRRQIDAIFNMTGIRAPTRVVTAPSVPILAALIRCSDMLAFMPRQMVRNTLTGGGLEMVEMPELPASRTFGLRTLREHRLSPEAALLKQIFIELGPGLSSD
jgi:LysR family transcriptional regulator of abg operon